MSIRFTAVDRLTIADFDSKFTGLVDLLAVTGFVDNDARTDALTVDNLTADATILRHSLVLSRVAYASPLSIGLTWASSATGCLASARGLLYLWSQYMDLRVKHQRSEIDVAALKMIRDALPALPDDSAEPVNREQRDAEYELLELRRRLREATQVLRSIHSIDFQLPDLPNDDAGDAG